MNGAGKSCKYFVHILSKICKQNIYKSPCRSYINSPDPLLQSPPDALKDHASGRIYPAFFYARSIVMPSWARTLDIACSITSLQCAAAA